MNSQTHHFIAIDLGAGSGRVILAEVSHSSFRTDIIYTFKNPITNANGHQRWDINYLFEQILEGLKKVSELNLKITSIGIDTWGLDYGLFSNEGSLLENPIFYRDQRIVGQTEKVFQKISKEQVYQLTGIQSMDVNTINQLHAHVHEGDWPKQTHAFYMIPDILHYYLCGTLKGEYTNASTTGLLNVYQKNWELSLFDKLGIPQSIAPELVQPGQNLGMLKKEVLKKTSLNSDIKVIVPATHDTASAVIGTPLNHAWAFLSSGTWSLIGIELDNPIVGQDAMNENFSNEGGAFNTIRFLKNVMGLWILESCRKEWQVKGEAFSFDDLKKLDCHTLSSNLIFPDAQDFLNPDSMLNAIQTYLSDSGQTLPKTPLEYSKVIFDSLAFRYASIFEKLQIISNTKLEGIHIIGGGSQNDYLNQMTANILKRPIKTGPVEATAIGNICIQMISADLFHHIDESRQFLEQHIQIKKFVPQELTNLNQAQQLYSNLENAP